MKHWVFDLDGTLVDSFSHFFESMREIHAEHGVEFAEDQHLSALTDPLHELFARNLGSAAVPRAFERLQARSNADALRIRAFPGLLGAIEGLVSRGARVAVWTNRDLESASLILKASGLDRFAELCVSGTCVERRKPDPEGLLRVLGSFRCEPSQVTMVGDHEHDVSAAKRVGARAVRASWHGYWKMESCARADHQFHSVEEFEAWLSRLS